MGKIERPAVFIAYGNGRESVYDVFASDRGRGSDAFSRCLVVWLCALMVTFFFFLLRGTEKTPKQYRLAY